MTYKLKAIIFFSLLVIFTILVVVPVKVPAVQIPGATSWFYGMPVCNCPFEHDITCGCAFPE